MAPNDDASHGYRRQVPRESASSGRVLRPAGPAPAFIDTLLVGGLNRRRPFVFFQIRSHRLGRFDRSKNAANIVVAIAEHIPTGVPTRSPSDFLIRSVLADMHAPLFAERSGSTSYLVAVVVNGLLTIAYEGDCSCGVANAEGRIDWITPPHCLANWKRDRSHRELACDPARHRITRSYKAGRAPEPEIVIRSAVVGERLVFATDGFWGEMSEVRQAEALRSPEITITDLDDDVTWIDVRL